MRLTFFKHISAARSLSLVAQNSNKRRFIVRESNIIFFLYIFAAYQLCRKKIDFLIVYCWCCSSHTHKMIKTQTLTCIFLRGFNGKGGNFSKLLSLSVTERVPKKKNATTSNNWAFVARHRCAEDILKCTLFTRLLSISWNLCFAANIFFFFMRARSLRQSLN